MYKIINGTLHILSSSLISVTPETDILSSYRRGLTRTSTLFLLLSCGIPSPSVINSITLNQFCNMIIRVHYNLFDFCTVISIINSFRHATELAAIVGSLHSTDNVTGDNPIFVIVTDGGPDHRLTYVLVKVSDFLCLNLDMLVSIETGSQLLT